MTADTTALLVGGMLGGLLLLVILGIVVRQEGWPFLLAFLGTAAAAVMMLFLEPFIPGLSLVVVPVTALVAAWDSWRVQYSEYKGGNSPVIVFLGCLALWLVVLPWYLARRRRITQGTLPRREAPPPPLRMAR